jgi:hypothetical protein
VGFVVNSVVLEQGTFPELSFSPLSITPPMIHVYLHLHVVLTAWEPPKSNALSEFGKLRLDQCCHTCCEGRKPVVGTVA